MSRIFAYYMLFLSSLFSQDLKQLQGFVEDQTSGRIAGAKILLRSETTNRTAHTITADDGSFRFQNIPAGKSRIRVEHPGFETVDQDIDLLTTSEITIKLSASAVVESVKVSASAVLIQSEAAAQAATLTTQQIEQLPTASRNYTHLIVGEAGVAAPLPDRTGRGMNLATAPGSQADDGTQSLNPSVNGARPTNNANDQRR